MKNAIYASIYHAVSTDEEPQHQYCPKGSSSWCFYQASIAKNITPGLHKTNVGTPINKLAFSKIRPLYERLTDDSLLLRCSRCLTQNANECLHSIIWNRCPKEVFVSKTRIKIAASISICEYNFGQRRTVSEILKQLGLLVGESTISIAKKRDETRLVIGLEKATEKFKNARRIMALAQNRREEVLLENEGLMYSPGMF
ncbi:hypothetical protein ALC57_00059 [Trachymyrmex cornetzi]|uniref:Uncharacterized protein n=1 Tax=Trachymyrmex cornetzi TaxID=471704 RepID=A0A151K2W7_9HYME|nr:hypothetical protein ALC57_00059 [Trachymyrmex cornetzi]